MIAREVKTTCCYCGVGCGMIATTDGEQLTAVRGDPEHPANFGRLCTKGSSLHLTMRPALQQQARLLSPQLQATDVSWCAGQAPASGTYAAKTRYRQADAPCDLQTLSMADGQAGFELRFSENQWAVTPGQSAVVYDGDVCLGGGVIHSSPTLLT